MMGQNVQKVLQALGLRSDVGTVNAVKKAFGGNGSPFPFEGDALIDGTLNIDFTETLDFFMGDVDEEFGPVELDGPFIGLRALKDNTLILSGLIDNADGAIEDVTVVASERGFVLESKTDSEDVLLHNTVAFFPDVDGEMVAFSLDHSYFPGPDRAVSIWAKFNDAFESVSLGYRSNVTGLELNNDLSDNEASLLNFRDNNDDRILDIRNDGIYVGPNIPTSDPNVLGKIWIDGDALKVSGYPL